MRREPPDRAPPLRDTAVRLTASGQDSSRGPGLSITGHSREARSRISRVWRWDLAPLVRLSCEFALKPRSGKLPIAHHALRRNLENLRRLLHAQTTEEPQLDYPRLPRIDLGHAGQGVVESD